MSYLQSGKVLAAVVGMTTISAVVAIFALEPWRSFCLVAAAVLFGIFLTLQVYWARKVEARRRQDQRKLLEHTQILGSLKNVPGSVAKTRESQRFQEEQIEALRGQLEAVLSQTGIAAIEEDKQYNYFSPKRIQALKIGSKPNAHIAGRAAALEERQAGSDSNQRAVLEPRVEISRTVGAVASKLLLQALTQVCEVDEIRSPADLGNLSGEVSYLVLEERALTTGRWFGALSSQGTDTFYDLYKAILALRRASSVIVVVVANAPATHMTGSLRGVADLVITEKDGVVTSAAEELSPVLQAVREYVK